MKYIFTINNNYFDKIDNEEKAYWLGFMYADGYIRQRGDNSWLISLCQNEKSVLEKFLKSLNSNHNIGKYVTNTGFSIKKESIYYKVTIHSEKLFKSLNRLGCIPNKSLILKFPTEEQVPEYLISHFIRGYFDGDGCVCISKSTRHYKNYSSISNYLLVNICGTIEFLESLKRVLPFIEYKDSIIHKEKKRISNCYRMDFTSTKRSNLFYNYIYKNATIYLDRKKETFRDYNENYHKKVDRIVRSI